MDPETEICCCKAFTGRAVWAAWTAAMEVSSARVSQSLALNTSKQNTSPSLSTDSTQRCSSGTSEQAPEEHWWKGEFLLCISCGEVEPQAAAAKLLRPPAARRARSPASIHHPSQPLTHAPQLSAPCSLKDHKGPFYSKIWNLCCFFIVH